MFELIQNHIYMHALTMINHLKYKCWYMWLNFNICFILTNTNVFTQKLKHNIKNTYYSLIIIWIALLYLLSVSSTIQFFTGVHFCSVVLHIANPLIRKCLYYGLQVTSLIYMVIYYFIFFRNSNMFNLVSFL